MHGQLSRRREDEGRGLLLFRVSRRQRAGFEDARDDGKQEGGGFATSGLSAGHQVASAVDDGNGVALNRSRLLVLRPFHVGQSLIEQTLRGRLQY